MERKKKDKKRNKWKRSSSVYIYLKDDRALGFTNQEPIEIDVEDEIEKGNSVEILGINIGHVIIDCWEVPFEKFYSEFVRRAGVDLENRGGSKAKSKTKKDKT